MHCNFINVIDEMHIQLIVNHYSNKTNNYFVIYFSLTIYSKENIIYTTIFSLHILIMINIKKLYVTQIDVC